ncbi:MAG: hypothetical protein GY861_25155 [bacterium]|nr:hypothetical protein [bacterium]
MKCYAIKSGEEFIEDGYKAISTSYYSGASLKITDCDDDAKHYKSATPAKAWVRKYLKSYTADVPMLEAVYEEKLKEHNFQKGGNRNYYGNGWALNQAKGKYESAVKILSWLQKAEVVELELDEPNFPSDLKVTWNAWYAKQDKKVRMLARKDSKARTYCKSCGVTLKNVPYFEFPEANSMKVCVCCLKLKVDEINSTFERMDVKHREKITNELILGGI